MAISKIKLGTGNPVNLRDSASMHYVGHATSGITESAGVYTSSTTLVGITGTIVKHDYITYGEGNENYVCTDVTGTTATWALLSEAAVVPPVQIVKVNGTALVPDTNHAVDIPAATNAAFGVVETGSNITNTNGVISVADATTAVKGDVTLSESIPTSGADNTTVPTTLAVKNAIDALPEPMVFKGTVGTSGTVEWANLPEAAVQNVGWTYKVITKHTSAPVCEVGDTIICANTSSDTYEWTVIPSGDEPAGTVTSVQAAAVGGTGLIMGTGTAGATGDPITDSGTITVGLATGYAIPTTTQTTAWAGTTTEVSTYTTNNSVMNGVAVAASQATGGVLVMSVDGTDEEQLNVLYLNPSTISNAVCKTTS